jgi:hypothetical protein
MKDVADDLGAPRVDARDFQAWAVLINTAQA